MTSAMSSSLMVPTMALSAAGQTLVASLDSTSTPVVHSPRPAFGVLPQRRSGAASLRSCRPAAPCGHFRSTADGSEASRLHAVSTGNGSYRSTVSSHQPASSASFPLRQQQNGAAGTAQQQQGEKEAAVGASFFSSDLVDDPDRPSQGLSAVGDAVAAIARGEMVVVVDDEDRENEGDLIMAGSLVTPEKMAFIVKHSSGLVCAGVAPSILDKLEIPLMVQSPENDEAMRTAFTVSVDLGEGTSTGISAADRAATVRALAHHHSVPSDFRRPGHVFPLRYREGGVLNRPGHTEAAVDLAIAAGLPPVGVLCEIVDWKDPKGSMARLPRLKEFAKAHNLHIISIADLIRYRRKRERIVERTAVARLPTKWGVFQMYTYTSHVDGLEHAALVKGEIGDGVDVLVRLHSECLTGDAFSSLRCDCGPQLELSLQRMDAEGRGACVYLRGHEGRGIGLGQKIKAYSLQDQGRDTVEANLDLGLPADAREYSVGAQILLDLGVRTMRLMTNNPAKFAGLKGHGLAITGRVPLLTPITMENRKYLEAKRQKMGHVYGSDLPGSIAGLLESEMELGRLKEEGRTPNL